MKPTFQIIRGDAARLPLADGSVDLTVTSPPYDTLRDYQGFAFNFQQTAKELYRVTKQCGVVVWIVGDETIEGSETGNSFRQALHFKEVGFNLHDTMIYHKDSCPFPETTRYYPAFEYMFIFSKGRPKTTNLLRDKSNKRAGSGMLGSTQRERDGTTKPKALNRTEPDRVVRAFGIRQNVWTFSPGFSKSTSDEYAFQHPAIFPEQLAYDHILSWSNKGDTVLDPFCGSGTTGKMAIISGRNFVGVEISQSYCELSRVRIMRASGVPCEIPRRIVPEKDLPLFSDAEVC